MKIAKTGYEIDGFHMIANLVGRFLFFPHGDQNSCNLRHNRNYLHL